MKKPVTSKSYFLTLTIVYGAQVLVMVAFSGVIFFLHSTDQLSQNNDLKDVLQYVVPVVVITSLSGGHIIFKMIISKINPAIPLKEKLPKYLSAVLVRSAIIEVSGLLGAVAAMITGEIYFLAATLLIVAVFILLRPTAHTLAEDLSLSAEDRNLLQDPEAIVSEV